MNHSRHQVASGLEGVVVANTQMSMVDGQAGRLVIRGHDVRRLSGEVCFEAACGLLLDGELPRDAEVAAIREALAVARRDAYEGIDQVMGALRQGDAMAALRGAVGQWGGEELRDRRAAALRIVGALPVWSAAWWRLRKGQAPVAPELGASHSADMLAMLHGGPATRAMRQALDAYLVAVIDHGMNASTFTARVVASTGADLTSAVTAAIGALSGPLHGGAPGPVLDMLDDIGRPEDALAWIEGRLAQGERIMGMGHRVYKVRDPRAAVLERALRGVQGSLTERTAQRLALARVVEQVAKERLEAVKPGRRLNANVEFYTAVLLEALEVPRQVFAATFCASRAMGWCAHVFEQRDTGRLLRPSARYTGAVPQAR